MVNLSSIRGPWQRCGTCECNSGMCNSRLFLSQQHWQAPLRSWTECCRKPTGWQEGSREWERCREGRPTEQWKGPACPTAIIRQHAGNEWKKKKKCESHPNISCLDWGKWGIQWTFSSRAEIPFSFCMLSSVQFSCSVVSDSLPPHGLQHAMLPCPSSTPGVDSNSCPLSWWGLLKIKFKYICSS